MAPDHDLANRFKTLAFFIGKIRKPDLSAGVELRMFANQILDQIFQLIIKGFIGGAHIGEFRATAFSRDRPCRQQRIGRRYRAI